MAYQFSGFPNWNWDDPPSIPSFLTGFSAELLVAWGEDFTTRTGKREGRAKGGFQLILRDAKNKWPRDSRAKKRNFGISFFLFGFLKKYTQLPCFWFEAEILSNMIFIKLVVGWTLYPMKVFARCGTPPRNFHADTENDRHFHERWRLQLPRRTDRVRDEMRIGGNRYLLILVDW